MNHNRRMLVRLCAFVVWGLVAASAVFWGLRVSARGQATPAHAVAVGEASVTRGDLSRLLGTGPAPAAAAPVATADPDAASRYRLIGVMAPKRDAGGAKRSGLALIAVDGKPAKAYAVGAVVDGDMVLQRVSLRSAAIGPAQAGAVILEVPPLTAAATGTIAPAVQGFGAAAPPGRLFVRPVPQVMPPPPGASMPPGAFMQQRESNPASQ